MVHFPDRRKIESAYADIQVETTRMVFDGLMPTILTGCISIVVATIIMAVHYADRFLWWFALAAFLASAVRVAVVSTFNQRSRRGVELTAADAYHWELTYGQSTIVYTTVVAALTIYTFRFHDYSAQSWVAMGTFAISSGISARLGLRPWIAQASGTIMLVALLYAVLRSDALLVRWSASSVIAYMYLYCESIKTKHHVLVDQIRTKRQLVDLAEHDALTGLANRRQFEAAMARACRQDEAFAILYIDLDRFKAVNDTFGHAVGDGLLQATADRLRTMVRQSDLVARLGGDEFAVLQVPPATWESAEALAMRINHGIAQTFEIAGHSLHIGASAGVRLKTSADTDPSALLSSADRALYEVKKRGRGGFSIAAVNT